jgi:hypothetical protein
MSWLALMLAVVITGDFVEDLVFEPMDFSDTSGMVPLSEEPDEHVLMPSPKADPPGDGRGLQLSTPADAHLRCLEPFIVRDTESARPYFEETCKPRPPSSVQVLRI